MNGPFQPDWHSLREHVTPRWFKDAKFGIYAHWGVYSVPACGPGATWYARNMYKEGTEQYEHHVRTYGPPSKFGYKDFIPMFTAEKFDADQWAELFQKAGAQFAGPVGQHHDGFAMWDSQVNRWNAVRMGPRRDVVGQLEKAIRRRQMRFMVALHHAENWWFYPHWRKDCDTSDPRYSDLYGPPHDPDGQVGPDFFDQQKPDRPFLERWKAQILEVIHQYRPDMLWFDFGLYGITEEYRKEFLADYYNQAVQWGREVVVTYKEHYLVPGSAVLDIEAGRLGGLTYHDWITDTSVDDRQNWSYTPDSGYKSATALVHNLVDNVSKNGYLLLNVNPMADGQIPEPAQQRLLGIGQWLQVNGEAIYGTTPWMAYGEGPTQMKKAGPFCESDEVTYTGQDIRFTAKGDALYAICLGWPGAEVTIASAGRLYESEIRSVRMLGVHKDLPWSLTPQGLTVRTPAERPCEHAYVLKIARRRPF